MTRYTVTAERGSDSRVWVFQCVEHPGAISQGRRLADAHNLMPEAIGWVAGVDPATVEVDVQPVIDKTVAAELGEMRRLRQQAEEADRKANALHRQAAKSLHDAGLTVRDIGTVLHVSHQRAHQLIKS